jgi:tetratricopeptide (TPR) repeat protein
MADEMRKEFPQKETNDIRLLVAGSLSKLKRYEEADSTYQIIYKIEPTANILTEWADLELLAGKTDTAIDKLNQALTKEKTPQRLIKLLRAVYDYAPDSLGTYWNSWGNLFSPPPAQAQFIMLQWYYDNGNWVLCDSLANGLLLNDELPIRSKAQLYKGISQFKLGNLDAAIIELYKAIYLYPDLSDIVLEAKKYIIKTYLLKSQAPEARAVYDEIIDSLSPEEIAEFDQLFAGQQY